MSDAYWISITNGTGLFGFGLSISANTILLVLIVTKNSPVQGPYKNILISFCVFTMFYTCVEMFLRPLIHIQDDTLFVMQQKKIDMGKGLSRVTTTLYCGCYAMSFVLFALQFLYRYVATCKPEHVDLFKGKRFLLWILAAICISLSWEAAAYFLFPQSARTDEVFELILKSSYALGTEHLDYIPYRYFESDNGVRNIIWLNVCGVIQHVIIMAVSFGTLFFCAFSTYSKIGKHKGMSEKTKELQMQLFRALVVQAAIPMMFMYCPLLFLYACPMFDLQLGAMANYQTICGQLYPGVDPFAILLLINAYRRALFTVYTWCYSMSYALLALQFVYRYIAVCKANWLDYIEGRRMYVWIFGSVFVCGAWTSGTLMIFEKTDETEISFNEFVENYYSLDIATTDYIPYQYFHHDHGERQLKTLNLAGVAQHLVITLLSIVILIFCGASIYLTAKKQNSTSSVNTRDLQVQLFRALVFQTLCPVLFNFIPLTFLFMCPLLGIHLGAYTNYQVIITQLYPWIDPLVMLFIIEDYRSTLLLVVLFKCETKIAVSDYDQSQYTDFMAMEHDTRRVTVF